MANYQEARVKLTNTQLNKLKSAANYKTGTIWRLNAIANDMSTYINLIYLK